MIDTTVLARAGSFNILAEHKLVRWPDGSTIALHRVIVAHDWAEVDAAHLALQEPATQAWLVFPIAPIDPALAEDLRAAHWLDAPGLIYFNLRQHYAGSDALRKAVLAEVANNALRARVRDVRRAA